MLIFTDGSFSRKPKMAGMGAIIVHKNNEFTIGGYSNKCEDNNVAEVAAIAMAIKYAKEKQLVDDSKTITIISDSSYALRKIQMNRTGRDEFEQQCLDYIENFLIETNKKVNFLQVKGHIHDGTKLSHYNNIADDIAGQYRMYGLERYNNKIIHHKKYKSR